MYDCFIAEPAICERAVHLEKIQTARLALDSDQIKGNGSCRKYCHHCTVQRTHQNLLAAATMWVNVATRYPFCGELQILHSVCDSWPYPRSIFLFF